MTIPVNQRSRVTVDVPEGRITWWFVDRAAGVGCPKQHSSIYGFDHIISAHQRPIRR